jgi:CRISP-associated protein Cas1
VIRRTIFIGSAAYLSRKDAQLVVEFAESNKPPGKTPIEDIGLLVLDHPQITLTHGLLQALMAEGAAVLTSDAQYLPDGLLLPLAGHHLHQARLRTQVEATLPLRKQLWRGTVQAKLRNQAAMLPVDLREPLKRWAATVRSGDPENLEGRGAAYYWRYFFGEGANFRRSDEAAHWNAWLNYGYAILRSAVARAIVGAGLHPALGLHHRNQYNAYTLADDLMEPYRPYVDAWVRAKAPAESDASAGVGLSRADKAELLQIPMLDVPWESETLPMMIAAQRTAVGLTRCLAGESRRIPYPDGEPIHS